jgi:hypothetical protein
MAAHDRAAQVTCGRNRPRAPRLIGARAVKWLSPPTEFALGRNSRTRSHDQGIGRRLSGALTGRQLNHSCVLARPQTGDKHSPPVGEFQRIVMDVGVAQVDLPKPSHVGPELAPAWQQAPEDMIEFGFPIEHHLGTWKQADRNARLPDRGEAAGR